MCLHDRGCKCTCAFKVSTEFEAFADAALGVRRKSFLYVLHTYTARAIFTLPKESIYEHLQREKILNLQKAQEAFQTRSGFQTSIGVTQGSMLCSTSHHNCVNAIYTYN